MVMRRPSTPLPGGRPRDQAIDEAVLQAALQALAHDGLTGLSMTKVAASAGTTRTAIYRRWPTKTALAVAAVARLAQADRPAVTGDPFIDLVVELEHFRQRITEAGSLPLAGAMLADAAEPEVRRAYLDQVVAPRRTRFQALLQAGIDRGELPANADIEQAGTSLTGSWYAYQLAGIRPPDDWPLRAATFVWRGCGGTPPEAARSPTAAAGR
jgi:AcrR family transcriptional regulator